MKLCYQHYDYANEYGYHPIIVMIDISILHGEAIDDDVLQNFQINFCVGFSLYSTYAYLHHDVLNSLIPKSI